MQLLLGAKTQVPKTFGQLIERPRLLAQLDRCLTVPITLVSAPAGFGKTTLLCQWVNAAALRALPRTRIAWLSLDEGDSRLEVFLAYFIAALRVVYPDACDRTFHLLAGSQTISEEALSISMVNELAELEGTLQVQQEHLVVALDDYHSIEGHAVNQLLTALMKNPPDGFHLILGSRHDPALPLARWRAHDRALELRTKDLRLNHTEVVTFLREAVPIEWNDAQISAFEEKTEGWAAGLHLISLAVREQAEAQRLAAHLDVTQEQIANYLFEEVLARQPRALQTQLIQLSILDRFNAALCETVCRDLKESGAELLAHLSAANLFLVGLDSQGEWFRFHQLFQQLLRYQLKQRVSAAEQTRLHRDAMNWFAEHNDIEQALMHAFAAGEIAGAAELVAKHRRQLMNQEQWQRLAGWLSGFSNETLAQSPDLLLTKAWLTRTINFDLEATAVLARQAANALALHKYPRQRTAELGAEIDTLLALEAYRVPDPDRAATLAAHAVQVLPTDSYLVRHFAYLQLAAAYQMQGDLERGIRLLRDAQTEEILSGYDAHARASGSEAVIQWVAGNLPAMLERGKYILSKTETNGFYDTGAWGHYFVAAASYMRNDLVTAEINAAMVLNDPNPSGSFRPTLDSALILALVYQAKQMPDRARKVLDEALGWAIEKHSDTLIQVMQAFQAALALRQGNLTLANQWYLTTRHLTVGGAMVHFSSPLLTLPQVLLAQNTEASRQQAHDFLQELQRHLDAIHNVRFRIDAFALQAVVYDARGDSDAAMRALNQSLALAEPGGFVRVFVDLGTPMAKLVQLRARERDAGEYVKQIARAFPNGSAAPSRNDTSFPIEPLTERENVVLQFLARRLTNKEIARELYISPLTVKAHTDHIYQKLGVNSRQDAARVAHELGLLES